MTYSSIIRYGLLAACLLPSVLLPEGLRAQDRTVRSVLAAEADRLIVARHRAERAHLARVGFWGGANIALGVALLLATRRAEHPGRHAFGVQTLAWGAVNTGIAAVGWWMLAPPDPSNSLAGLRAENTYYDVLLVNMGLNVGYMGVGAALWAAGRHGVRSAASWRGHGRAVVLQGLGLFVLDGIALLASRSRWHAWMFVVGGEGPGGPGLGLTVPF